MNSIKQDIEEYNETLHKQKHYYDFDHVKQYIYIQKLKGSHSRVSYKEWGIAFDFCFDLFQELKGTISKDIYISKHEIDKRFSIFLLTK